MKAFVLLTCLAVPALAQGALAQSDPDDLPPGLVSAELLPGWITPDGHRMTALRLELEPGWKTYWRSPGDAGVPPRFDWQGSQNMAQVTPHWPRPEAIESGGERTLGYHDQLVLPLEIAPATPGQPVDLQAKVDFGLCLDICVPAHIVLTAPPVGDGPDPLIQSALAEVPEQSPDHPLCRIEEIADGMRVTALFPDENAPEVAMELPDTWVSQPELEQRDGMLHAQADFVGETGKPFALDPSQLVLTLIAPDHATEYRGCNTEG
ncbi:protein-disulfide reductase DsbD domain-containing protein [Paracoccus laeviglucosivorans]|uniref:Thiol-disulfide interchange protein, contains DsbC and DsbD domains n=1 Tax=Paracoccus laeviglucosivorans TaxID=1197861 RepID=A0A521DZ68_9RHOB|nr:protein-disulfide reductase DsbD domain-containing protein [Paracoccus laeviglucosivorans]SMO76912.1 Thiol-disulfide interchange protein, contains DsbC and DsbD domains [Paracoccus laeviglucosivorans]